MENTVEEWQIELKRLQKCQIIGDNEKQSEALNFVLDCLVYLKKYHPLIKTMRVKGLTARHWRQINSELGLQIDPSTTCFLRLIGMELHKEDPIQIIKNISDVAQKEHAIMVQTESL